MGTNITGIGNANAIGFKSRVTGGMYFPPELKDALVGVWSAYGKSNDSTDRNIIKNKIKDRGGDFELINFNYEGTSGYNGYPIIFGKDKTYQYVNHSPNYNQTTINVTHFNTRQALLYSYIQRNGELTSYNRDYPSYKIKVSGLEEGFGLMYQYNSKADATSVNALRIEANGIYTIPKSFASDGSLINANVWVGFVFTGTEQEQCNVTIEVLPEYKGAVVTDGVNDMIVSQNPVSEMLGGSNELTVVSMMCQISDASDPITRNNWLFTPTSYLESRVEKKKIGKTGIYGYTSTDIRNGQISNVNTILGDKNDYIANSLLDPTGLDYFSVEGFENQGIWYTSSVAWYWTFIAKRALTTDEINQVIAYYNLDKYVKPDIYYNVKKQGLTNDNHAQFGDKLIDYSGNSRDLQLFNIDWNPGSGIGKYVTNFGIWSKDAESKISYNSYSFTVNGSLKRTWLMWYVTELPSFKIKVSGINSNGYVDYGYYDNGSLKNFRLDKDGIHTLPPSGASSNGHGFKVNDTSLDWTGLVIEQIPDFAGALCFDGVDDFGINKDVPTFTDFTVIAKRTWLEENTSDKPFIIKGDSLYPDGNQNAFLFEYGKLSTYSFGQNNKYDESVVPSLISYATTYSYNGVIPLVRGSATDTIGIDVAHSTKIALYFLMLFPYSMSEFLIERQLKKHKLGTLYPGMVEFRPIISGRTDLIKEIKWYSDSWSKRIYVGDYIPRGVDVTANILLNDNTSELVKATYGNNYTEVRKQANWSETNNEWDLIIHNIGKSPQKIGITIDKYIRFEDIVQPYPAKFRFTDVDSGQVYDWGSKIKVGSTIKILSNVDIGNYLSDIYTINGYKYNGNIYSYNELKELTFLITNQPLEFASRKTYKLGGSEPKVILYPERLKLSNDTYKRLGYIPDLTGNGNHGVFNNLAFTEESGVNEDGSVHLDGVDDYISIPTLSKGGKQVLMKVNWSTLNGFIYDQRPASGDKTFGIYTQGDVIAYSQHNNGNTYIDGIINNNIIGSNLSKITHNIVATCDVDNSITPSIGKRSYSNSYFAQMALYAFMLFDEISTDEGIKELNNIVGIEGDYVQKPSYYWDAYGKSNLDVDKGYIKDQVSLQLNNDTTNNNSLENFNFGYEGMSGYNGYPVIFGANKTWKNKAPEGPNSYICTINANKYNITQILLSNAWTYSYIKENGELTKYNKDVESFKIKVTGLKSEIPLRYSYLSSTDATVTSNITIKSDGTYELPKSFANDGSLIDNYGWIGFSFTRISVDIPEIITDVNITIEILPEYKNGLVYDGVDDYSENASIPLLSDYTYIFKRTLLNKKYNSASIFKGSNQQSGGGAFICDYNSVEPDLLTQGYSFGAGLYVDSLNADSIVYGTRGSVNGTKITAGNNTDTEGLTVGKWRAYKEMVFYKLFLYPRTVNMLSINMVKNMMEEDGIIDLTSKLFTDKYTGDFYEMDFNNDFLIGN